MTRYIALGIIFLGIMLGGCVTQQQKPWTYDDIVRQAAYENWLFCRKYGCGGTRPGYNTQPQHVIIDNWPICSSAGLCH